MDYIFKRKIYQQMQTWKELNQGKSALLIEGARRIGKSTVVEQFAKQEYKSPVGGIKKVGKDSEING